MQTPPVPLPVFVSVPYTLPYRTIPYLPRRLYSIRYRSVELQSPCYVLYRARARSFPFFRAAWGEVHRWAGVYLFSICLVAFGRWINDKWPEDSYIRTEGWRARGVCYVGFGGRAVDGFRLGWI
jgi:hypothetical protein